MHDMRSDQRWTLEEVQEREALLSEVVAGAGAGYSYYLVASRATLGPPQWAAREARELSRVISTAILRSRGIDVTDVIDQGCTVVIGDDEPDVQGLMEGLASLSALLNRDDVIRVKRGSGQFVAEIEVSAFREWSQAEEVLQGSGPLRSLLQQRSTRPRSTGGPRGAAGRANQSDPHETSSTARTRASSTPRRCSGWAIALATSSTQRGTTVPNRVPRCRGF